MEKSPVNGTEKKQKKKLKQKILKKREDISSFLNSVYIGEKTYNKIVDKIINAVKVFIVASKKFMIDDCLTKASSTAYTS